MISMLVAAILADDSVRYTFRLVPPHPVTRVNLAGTFNGWDKGATAMKPSGDGKTWTVAVPLKPGKYAYKFVLDGEEWIVDPAAKRNEGDGNGHTNSILLIVPPDYGQPASARDGIVAKSALEHRTEVPYLNLDRGQLTLTFRTRPRDVSDLKVVVDGLGKFPMGGSEFDEFYQQNKVRIRWDRRRDLRYHFEFADGGKRFAYGTTGLTTPGQSRDFRLVAQNFKPFETPSWVEGTVVYQIFPDRFDNGDRKNDPAKLMPWGGKPTYDNRFGGDLAGVRKHLGYLKDLGVSTVYFNPIFEAGSNHRYDTVDYLKIDPELGTNEEFGALTREMKRKGIRTVVDGVFNHTATTFFAFDDVVRRGKASKYTSWYTFRSFPVKVQENPNYVAWFNFPSMPKLNHGNPATRAYLLNVPVFWSKHAEIAGWRLDVANEVPEDYWQDFRRKVKGIDPNMWILGEEWGDASRWLKGDQWDSVMNYPFRSAVLNFVGKEGTGRPSQLLSALTNTYGMYVPQVSRNAMNLLGSHDTPRILTQCGGDRELAKLAAAIQFTWAGTPSVYYGDEIGMEGDKDPDNRRCMEWDKATKQNDFLNYYRRLIALRNGSPVLQSGEPLALASDDAQGTASYARISDAEKGRFALVALNRSDVPREVTIPLAKVTRGTFAFIDSLGGRPVRVAPGKVIVNVAPKSAAVLIPRSGLARLSRHGAGVRRVSLAPSPFSFH